MARAAKRDAGTSTGAEELSFEAAAERLEAIVDRLEHADLELEESLVEAHPSLENRLARGRRPRECHVPTIDVDRIARHAQASKRGVQAAGTLSDLLVIGGASDALKRS